MDPQFPKVWRLDKSVAGSGALGDLGAHVIDQSRYLVGDPIPVGHLTLDQLPGFAIRESAPECGFIGVLELGRQLLDHFAFTIRGQDERCQMFPNQRSKITHV